MYQNNIVISSSFFCIFPILQCIRKENCMYLSSASINFFSLWSRKTLRCTDVVVAPVLRGGEEGIGMVVAHATTVWMAIHMQPAAYQQPNSSATCLSLIRSQIGPVHLPRKQCWVTHRLSCAASIFGITSSKVVRLGPACQRNFGEPAHSGFILDFHFHIYDHYLGFIAFESVVDFFFMRPFFCILST
jgi:hypothetical protein